MFKGISSYTYGWAVQAPANPMNAFTLLQAATNHHFNCVQFGDNMPLHGMPFTQLNLIKEYSLQHQLRIELGARGFIKERINQYIDLCVLLQSPLLRFVIDDVGYEPTVKEVVQLMIEVEPILTEKNIVLAIENHDRFTARQLEMIMLAVNSPQVGICLDCANSIGANEGLEWVVQVLAPYTVNLHIKDFSIQRLPHKMGFIIEGAIAGFGKMNLSFVLEQLKKYNRCHSAILEQWVPPEATIENTIDKEKIWAEESIKYLQQIFKIKEI